MYKSKFNNPIFYWAILAWLSTCFLLNIYSVFKGFQWILLLPLFVQPALIILIVTKHKYVKISLKIWSMITLIIGPSMCIVGRLLQYLGKSMQNIETGFDITEISYFITNLSLLAIGIVIYIYSSKTISLIQEESQPDNQVIN